MTARGILNKVRPGKQTQTLEGESPCENLHSSFLASLLLAAAVTVRAQEQTNYINNYFFRQVWLYQEGVHIPRYTAGLQYSRWGLIQGRSAEGVKGRLKAAQSFEKAYLNFFGPGTWG